MAGARGRGPYCLCHGGAVHLPRLRAVAGERLESHLQAVELACNSCTEAQLSPCHINHISYVF